MALQTVNKCLSDAVCALAHYMSDGESRAVALIQSGNEILETARYSSEARLITCYLLLLHHVKFCFVPISARFCRYHVFT